MSRPEDERQLQVNSLSVSYEQSGDLVPVVDQVSFSLKQGEILAIVGESGCGKSQLALALSGLLPEEAYVKLDPPSRSLTYSMIFQDPLNALNPVLRVGTQIEEALRKGERNRKAAVIRLLSQVGIPEPELRLRQYPHEFSGGMRQRVLIAMALARKPDILIADEPTTALDVNIQAQILDLISDLNESLGITILFITHDLGLLRSFAERVLVMYAGKIVESCPVEDIFIQPMHPYTRALIQCAGMETTKEGLLMSIPGSVPLPADYPPGCRFHPRCSMAKESCSIAEPEIITMAKHLWACPVVSHVS